MKFLLPLYAVAVFAVTLVKAVRFEFSYHKHSVAEPPRERDLCLSTCDQAVANSTAAAHHNEVDRSATVPGHVVLRSISRLPDREIRRQSVGMQRKSWHKEHAPSRPYPSSGAMLWSGPLSDRAHLSVPEGIKSAPFELQ
ncbi:hypothetical protein L1887_54019 [Cichorium endivia]|nr:hypothetical protein L1887_54019 [Cichorium endivia]